MDRVPVLACVQYRRKNQSNAHTIARLYPATHSDTVSVLSYHTPAYVSLWCSRGRPTAQARRRHGGRVHQRWQQGSRIGSGHCVTCRTTGCRGGNSPRRYKRHRSLRLVRVSRPGILTGRANCLEQTLETLWDILRTVRLTSWGRLQIQPHDPQATGTRIVTNS